MQKLTPSITKYAVWLMDHLTAEHGSPAREAVLGHPNVVQRVVDLVATQEGEVKGWTSVFYFTKIRGYEDFFTVF